MLLKKTPAYFRCENIMTEWKPVHLSLTEKTTKRKNIGFKGGIIGESVRRVVRSVDPWRATTSVRLYTPGPVSGGWDPVHGDCE